MKGLLVRSSLRHLGRHPWLTALSLLGIALGVAVVVSIDLASGSALRAFEQSHPGVRVRRINPGDAGSFYTKLQTMLASGEPPDAFYVGAERVASFADMGLLEPLDARLEADAKAKAQNPVELAGFYPSTVAAFRYDGKHNGQGPLYGIPKDFTTVGFYYNKDIFTKAGVPFPKDDWSWDDYLAAARAIAKTKDANGEPYIGSEFVTWRWSICYGLIG